MIVFLPLRINVFGKLKEERKSVFKLNIVRCFVIKFWLDPTYHNNFLYITLCPFNNLIRLHVGRLCYVAKGGGRWRLRNKFFRAVPAPAISDSALAANDSRCHRRVFGVIVTTSSSRSEITRTNQPSLKSQAMQ